MNMKITTLLLASHGTVGAQAAEREALDLLAAQPGATALHHLVVVPDFWKGMMGDDWLNNAVTQIRFGRYVENQIAREMAEEVARVADAAQALGIDYSHELVLGKPAACLQHSARRGPSGEGAFDLVVIGSPRPKGVSGLRSRMVIEPLTRGLGVRLMIVPYPGDDLDAR